MAFSLGTTAGTGTITVASGSTVVTGTGTNFQAANIGAIIVVGAQWGVIATRTSTTSITLDRPFTTAVTASAYQISANIPLITQTGTDTSLSTLTGVPGVTVSPSTISIIYTITSATLVVSGSLIYDRLLNRLRFLNSASILTGSTSLPAMRITGTFNNSVSQSINGYSFKSPSYALLFESNPTVNSPVGNFIGTTAGSTSVFEGNIEFNLNAGTSPLTFVLEGNTTLQNGSIINARVAGFNVQFTTQLNASTLTVNNYNSYGCGMRVLGNTTNINNYLSVGAAGAINQASSAAVNNPIYAGLQDGGGSIGWRTVNNSLKYFQLLNFASSRSSLIGLAQGNATANSQTLQTNSLIVTAQDSTGVVQDMKLWAKDSNNGNRCSANYGAGLGFEIATTGDLTYTGLTNASGVATFPSIISAIYWQAASGVNASYKVDHRGNAGATSQNLIFYACSYNHNLSQQSPDMWAFNNATGLYNTSTSKAATYLLLADTSITQTDMATVAAYTTLDNNAELYDFAKYYLYTNFSGQTDTYVTGTGDAGSYNVIINQSAANVFTPSGSSIAIKTDDFSGNLTTSGSVILANGSILSNNTVSTPNVLQDIPTNLLGVTITGNLTYNTNAPITIQLTNCDIQGTISNTGSAQVNIVKVNSTIGTVGTNVVAQQFATVSAPNLIAGTRVRIFDEDNFVEMFNGVLATAGFNESFVYESDITITLTATYLSGVTAKLGLTSTGIFTATGATFLNSQADDTVYNSYAVNGSTVTGFTADYAQGDINLSVTTNFTAANLYAWWIYNETTEEGIRQFFGGITAIDTANIKINSSLLSIFLDNSTANFIYQTDSIRFFRADGVYPAKTITTGGGGISVNWSTNVYVAPPSSLPPIPTAAENAAAVRSELSIELARVDVAISTRNAVAPDNTSIAAIKTKTDTLVNTDLTGIATSAEIAALNDFDPATESVIVGTNNDKTNYELANNAITSNKVANNAFNNSSFTTEYFNSINAQVDTALADYDAPTKAELDAAEADIIAALPAAAPSASSVASAVRIELTTELGRIDVATSTRLPTSGYTAPPSVSAIRSEIDANSTKLDVAVGTRNSVAPNNADIAAIKAKTDNLPTDPADESSIQAAISAIPSAPSAATVASQVRTELTTELARVDVAISTRNAVAPDNTSIAAIKTKTDLIPALL
jgi:hypothetical protein